MIDEALRARIRRLFFAEHWKVGTIAAQLGVHHDAVSDAIGVERFVPRAVTVRPSMLDPFREHVEQTLAQYPTLTSTRLFEMLRARGYQGSVVQLRRVVARLRSRPRAEAFFRRFTIAGEEAQVDWGHFGKLPVGRAQRALSCFVMVLSWSRATFACFTLDQTLESFLRCHELAFRFFGGVARRILYDNLKSAVIWRRGDAVLPNDRLQKFSGHYGFEPKPCAPYRGNEKGRVERRIRDLREGFFAGRSYSSLDDLNLQLARWLEEVQQARRMPQEQTLTVREALATERQQLLPLPQHPFPCDKVLTVASGKTPYLRFDLNDYSIPHTLVRKPLTLVASDTLVRILDGTTEVARHQRSWSRGETIEDKEHIAALAREKKHTHEVRGRDRLRSACPTTDAFVAALIDRHAHMGSQVARLGTLLDRYGAIDLDRAMAEAIESNVVDCGAVATLLDRQRQERSLPPPLPTVLPDDPRVRDARVEPRSLATYDALIPKPETKS